MKITRGDVYLVSPPPGNDPKRRRSIVVVSRQTLNDSKADKLVCAPINTNADGRSTEVEVGVEEGLKHPSVINCDQLLLVHKSALTDYRGALNASKLRQLRDALRIGLSIE